MTDFLFNTLDHDGQRYPYAVYRPPGDAPQRALLFLHGQGECGADGRQHLQVGLPLALRDHAERWPFLVVLPQKPTPESEWEDHSAPVLAMLERELARHAVDPRRVALTGMSQGGHGVILLAAADPARFRAVAPVCGYAARRLERGEFVGARFPDDAEAARLTTALARLPTWFLHGADDPVVAAEESTWLHARLEAAGADTRLTVFPGVAHDAWVPAYEGEALPAWLEGHTASSP